MKKVLSIIILFSILMLSACTPSQQTPTDSQKPNNDVFSEILACMSTPSTSTYGTKEEYDAFIAEYGNKLPKNFVTWEYASTFGEVYGMVMTPNMVSYALIELESVNFYVYYAPALESFVEVSTSSVLRSDSDMRNINVNTDGRVLIKRNGFNYEYNRWGELLAISWYVDGVRLAIEGYFPAFPAECADTVVGKLLSTDDATAKAAMNEITKNLSK